MQLLIDDANIDEIIRIYDMYPIDGVTTNPSILAKSGRQPYEVLGEIRAFIGKEADLHVQAVGTDANTILKDAHRIISELGPRTLVKIPCIPEGFKAMQMLREEGIRTTGTAIYTPIQAYLAAKSGAEYVAPYINRIDNVGYDGIKVAMDIQNILGVNHLDTKVLAASFKNSKQVLELCEYGIGAATVAPDVIDGLVKNMAISAAINDFIKDFEGLVGEGKTMADC